MLRTRSAYGTHFVPEDSALLEFSQLQTFERPAQADLSLLREWLERPEGGDFFLRGREARIWEDDQDIVTLSSRRADRDCLTKIMCDKFIPWYHHHWGFRSKVLSLSLDVTHTH